MKKIFFILIAAVFALFFIGCEANGNINSGNYSANGPTPAVLTLFNESSFYAHVFRNFNPDAFDPTTLVATVPAGSSRQVRLYASRDQLIGCTFFIRYRVLLANKLETGTENIFIDAERTMSNFALVIENGRSYTRSIPQPPVDELRFVNGYIRVQNTGTGQRWIVNGSTLLQNLNDGSVWLHQGNIGFFEIPIPFLMDSLSVGLLRVRNAQGIYTNFPTFEMQRGMLYSFTVNDSGITGPVITPINPLAN